MELTMKEKAIYEAVREAIKENMDRQWEYVRKQVTAKGYKMTPKTMRTISMAFYVVEYENRTGKKVNL